MKRNILLDANMVIMAYDSSSNSNAENVAQAKEKVQSWLQDENVAFATTPLIIYEVLRGVCGDPARWETLKTAIASFECFDIRYQTGVMAAELYC